MMQLLLNELSLRKLQSQHAARDAMAKLVMTILKVQSLGGIENVLLGPKDVWSSLLAADYTFSHWVTDVNVELEQRQFLSSLLEWGPSIEELHEKAEEERGDFSVTHREDSITGLGLGLAYVRDHPVLSLRTEDRWSADPLPVNIWNLASEAPKAEKLCNLSTEECPQRRYDWLGRRTCLKPRYENPGHHDPAHPNFRGQGGATTLLPVDAEEVYRLARAEDPGGRTWWGMNDEGHYYRYQRHQADRVHWNGTTNPVSDRAIAEQDIPHEIRQHFTRIAKK